MLIRPSDVQAKAHPRAPLQLRRILGRPECERLSVTLMELDGSHPTTGFADTDTLYHVLDGAGRFRIDDESIEVEEHDFVWIGAGRRFSYEGRMRFLNIQGPAFSPERKLPDQ